MAGGPRAAGRRRPRPVGHGGSPVIVSCAPFRVSFVGGGSDLPWFYRRYEGAVLSCSIARYSFVIIHRFLDIQGGLEVASIADIPSGTGLGSSSSFCVALLNGLYAHAGKFVSKERLAAEACVIEIERLGEPIGKQDQYAAAFGGINFIEFHKNDSVTVEPLLLRRDILAELERSVMLFYTGVQRAAGKILAAQQAQLEHDGAAVTTLRRMVDLTYHLRGTLTAGDLDGLGRILHES